MTAVLHALYALHPVVPLLFLLLMGNGLLATAVYGLATGAPLDIGLIHRKARAGDGWAQYAWVSWLMFAASVLLLILLVLLASWAGGRNS